MLPDFPVPTRLGQGGKGEVGWVKKTQNDETEKSSNRHTQYYAVDHMLKLLDLPSLGTSPPVMQGSQAHFRAIGRQKEKRTLSRAPTVDSALSHVARGESTSRGRNLTPLFLQGMAHKCGSSSQE